MPELITVEQISDISKPEYNYIRDYFSEVADNKSKSFLAVYQKGGYERMIAGEVFLRDLLYSIKKQFLHNLDASDDYLYLEDIFKRNPPVPKELSKSLCKPELAQKWGFGYLKYLDADGNFKRK